MKASDWVGRWAGRTVACIASGPSLTPDDCEAVHAAGLPTVVTNTTFRMCPWADVLMGFDAAWWRAYAHTPTIDGGQSVDDVFVGARLTCSMLGNTGVDTLHQQGWIKGYGNSGTAAISLAIVCGAARVLLLGYDCQKTGGRTHWHADHPKPLGNAKSMPAWPRKFGQVAAFAASKRVPVINCSRETALKNFPRSTIAEALA